MLCQSPKYRHFVDLAKGIFAPMDRFLCEFATTRVSNSVFKGRHRTGAEVGGGLKIRRQHVFLVKGVDDIDGLFRIVAEFEEVEVLRRDVAGPQRALT